MSPDHDGLRIAPLLTCHNRRETTLRCLERLFACRLPAGVELDPILVDDGSTDGTADAVRRRFPHVHVVEGDGSLYWAGGTRLAMLTARERGADAHLWLNDDVALYPTALTDLIGTYREVCEGSANMAIVAGTMRDPETGALTYGGVRRASRWHPLKFELVPPGPGPREVRTVNGNLVLIPRAVVDAIGVLSEVYVHAIGDFAYGLEARRAGARVWICPGVQGECGRNDPEGTWEDPALPLRERLAKLRGHKGLPPRAYARLARLAGAKFWPAFVALPYARVLVTSLLYRLGIRGSAAAPSKSPAQRSEA